MVKLIVASILSMFLIGCGTTKYVTKVVTKTVYKPVYKTPDSLRDIKKPSKPDYYINRVNIDDQSDGEFSRNLSASILQQDSYTSSLESTLDTVITTLNGVEDVELPEPTTVVEYIDQNEAEIVE